jgi:Flp pilus assembly protein TadG
MLGRVRRVGATRNDERGAAIVEAAIIIPLLLILVFGAIEFGIGFRDAAAVAASTRGGARIASTLTSSDDTTFATNTALAVSDALKDQISSTPLELYVYHASDTTGNPVSGSLSGGACNECFYFKWNTTSKTWTLQSGPSAWTQAARLNDACNGTLPAVGVYVKAQLKSLTGLFGASRTTDQKTAMRLEPVSVDQCP